MDIKGLIGKMTLVEKAGLCSGKSFWLTKAVERLGIPSVMLSDGPHGLRKQKDTGDHLALLDSIEANCFPAGSATAASFDRDVVRQVGEALARECLAEDVAVILGPAMNIKRTPLCGRNFEYISEDPYLTGEMAVAYTQGVQSLGVGVSAKHYVANNQEHERMTGSSDMDERTLREIYLPAFESLVKKTQPRTIMSSYNKLNGKFVGEDRRVLSDILRGEWGFEGCVVSDWGAVSDRVASLAAGLDLEMPPSVDYDSDAQIVAAINEGSLSESVLDKAVERVLSVVAKRCETDGKERPVWNKDADHALAADIAKQCITLLKNDGILPLSPSAGSKIAYVGGFAQSPRYQGGGSSHIKAWKVSSAVEASRSYAHVDFYEGFTTNGDRLDDTLHAKAVKGAADADIAVVFAALPDDYETEGKDRTDMRLPNCQNALIHDIIAVQKNVIVVLQNGSPVEMPWVNGARAIVECYIGGEAVSEAVSDILFGKSNPCGKLPETFPVRLQDTPCYLDVPGAGKKTRYSEGIFVGYRYYDSKQMDVLFPFGHGLSYTTFSIDAARLSRDTICEGETVDVEATVTNTGGMAGKEIIQLYVRDATGTAVRPNKELKGFAAVRLEPGQTKTVSMTLDARAFQWYDADAGRWTAATGDYEVLIGCSSRDIRIVKTIRYIDKDSVPPTVTLDTQMGDLYGYPKAVEYVLTSPELSMSAFASQASNDPEFSELIKAVARYMPLRGFRYFGDANNEKLSLAVKKLNAILSAAKDE